MFRKRSSEFYFLSLLLSSEICDDGATSLGPDIIKYIKWSPENSAIVHISRLDYAKAIVNFSKEYSGLIVFPTDSEAVLARRKVEGAIKFQVGKANLNYLQICKRSRKKN